jgi:hypothetical protein
MRPLDELPTKLKPLIKKRAKALGITTRANVSEKFCYLMKTGTQLEGKFKTPFMVCKGYPSLIGDEETGSVWIAVVGLRDWFKTSPIISCKTKKTHIEFQTENSFYRLEIGK